MKILVAIPCMDMVHTAFMDALLRLQPVGYTEFAITSSSLIYNARNLLAQRAVDGGFDRILWLDSDMVFAPDLLIKLSADMDEGRDFVSALYFRRKNKIAPVIFKSTGYTQNGRELTPFAECFEDYQKDSVFKVAGCGFGAAIMSVKLVKQIYAEYGAPFTPQPGFGEDISFCIRCEQSGIPMYCDSRIKVGHVAQTIVTEESYERGVIL